MRSSSQCTGTCTCTHKICFSKSCGQNSFKIKTVCVIYDWVREIPQCSQCFTNKSAVGAIFQTISLLVAVYFTPSPLWIVNFDTKQNVQNTSWDMPDLWVFGDEFQGGHYPAVLGVPTKRVIFILPIYWITAKKI